MVSRRLYHQPRAWGPAECPPRAASPAGTLSLYGLTFTQCSMIADASRISWSFPPCCSQCSRTDADPHFSGCRSTTAGLPSYRTDASHEGVHYIGGKVAGFDFPTLDPITSFLWENRFQVTIFRLKTRLSGANCVAKRTWTVRPDYKAGGVSCT
ncbi:hypothetical protein Y1Q_0019982 [Alligator mississippiensis]|uniref:Uncharacterized protein n=1 Tax=Alligator mississippiensis TaxID=8496 RepID=A0A151PET5_ALLMI|nr:hypothetical protein Y1Q_0019982 [Alligator mississippiensis]